MEKKEGVLSNRFGFISDSVYIESQKTEKIGGIWRILVPATRFGLMRAVIECCGELVSFRAPLSTVVHHLCRIGSIRHQTFLCD